MPRLFILDSYSVHRAVIDASSRRNFSALPFLLLKSSHMRDEPEVARDWDLKIHNFEKGLRDE